MVEFGLEMSFINSNPKSSKRFLYNHKELHFRISDILFEISNKVRSVLDLSVMEWLSKTIVRNTLEKPSEYFDQSKKAVRESLERSNTRKSNVWSFQYRLKISKVNSWLFFSISKSQDMSREIQAPISFSRFPSSEYSLHLTYNHSDFQIFAFTASIKIKVTF